MTGSPAHRQLSPYRACALAAAVIALAAVQRSGMNARVAIQAAALTVDQPGLGECIYSVIYYYVIVECVQLAAACFGKRPVLFEVNSRTTRK